MHTTSNPQLGLLDSLMAPAPANEFLQRLDTALDWRPIERALQAMYPATTGRPPCAPLALFKMSLLQHCYGLSDPQCEEMVGDRLSWRRFVGLGLQDGVPDETTLVRFRQRLREHGLHEQLLGLVNRQLQQKGLILKTCTLVDATLLQAARRAPAKDDPAGGDGDAGYTVKQGRPHYGYKAHVAVDQTHTLIRRVTLTAASVHDSREFETVVRGDEEMVMADKAYWSRARREWCGRKGVANGILRKAGRGQTLHPATVRVNRLFSSIRCQIEKVFGWWKRSAGYRRVRYVGREANRLELEFKSIAWNLKRLVNLQSA
ncbi:MAG: IS5 family transposase [Verrucomicrobiae bacterium]|nr:IS5 family transposase [Verrucomicrobiae bacterium]